MTGGSGMQQSQRRTYCGGKVILGNGGPLWLCPNMRALGLAIIWVEMPMILSSSLLNLLMLSNKCLSFHDFSIDIQFSFFTRICEAFSPLIHSLYLRIKDSSISLKIGNCSWSSMCRELHSNNCVLHLDVMQISLLSLFMFYQDDLSEETMIGNNTSNMSRHKETSKTNSKQDIISTSVSFSQVDTSSRYSPKR